MSPRVPDALGDEPQPSRGQDRGKEEEHVRDRPGGGRIVNEPELGLLRCGPDRSEGRVGRPDDERHRAQHEQPSSHWTLPPSPASTDGWPTMTLKALLLKRR